MMRRHQGVGSSPTSPTNNSGYRKPTILKRHRKRMGRLDSKIARLDEAIRINKWVNPKLGIQQQEQRARADAQRKHLRLWMKGYNDGIR